MRGTGKMVRFWLNKTDSISIRAKVDTSNFREVYKSGGLDIINLVNSYMGSGKIKILVPNNPTL